MKLRETNLVAILAASGAFVAVMADASSVRAESKPDLRLRHAPVRMQMRTRPVSQPQVAAATQPPPTGDAAVATSADDGGSSTTRKLSERLIVRINAGVDLQNAQTSGQTLRGGYAIGDDFAASRPWIVGDAVVGTRDILMPSLNSYLLSSFMFDASGQNRGDNTALPAGVDARNQNLLIRAGYVEWGRDERAKGLRRSLWLRGGRQFRMAGGAMFAYFDGATVGVRNDSSSVTAFVGRRVALLVDTSHGTMFGASVESNFKKSRGLPLTVGLDFQGLAGFGGDSLRSLINLRGEYSMRNNNNVQFRARVVGNEGELSLGRVGARLNYNVNKAFLVIADVENRSGGDLAYDLAAPSAVDVVDVSRRLGVGLAAPVDATTVGVRGDLRRGKREYIGFARAELARGTIDRHERTGFVEAGAALATALGDRMWGNVQYLTRQRPLDDDANAVGQGFANTAGSGVSSLHELAVDAVWRSRDGRDGRKWRASGGGFYRVWSGKTAYAEYNNDGRGGVRGDLQYWYNRNWHLLVGGEVAQSSPTMARDLSTITSLRVGAEATF